MKICIIGANGQLGSDLYNELNCFKTEGLTHDDIEITSEKQCLDVIKKINPDYVLNTAAYHNVPNCEKYPDKAALINIEGAKNLAKACKLTKTELLHFSTDYVFDGKSSRPYLEDDLPNPLNYYAITKLAGEYAVKAYLNEHKIIRISGIYGKIPCRAKGGNFVSTMLKLSVTKKELKIVDDEILTPTYTKDIARQIKTLLPIKEYGVFHISNQGQCSWFEFATEIFKIKGIKIKTIKVPASEFPSEINRPGFSVLDNKRLKDLNIYNMQSWQKALTEHLKNL